MKAYVVKDNSRFHTELSKRIKAETAAYQKQASARAMAMCALAMHNSGCTKKQLQRFWQEELPAVVRRVGLFKDGGVMDAALAEDLRALGLDPFAFGLKEMGVDGYAQKE